MVREIGGAARVVGFATWAFGLLNVDRGPVQPRPCGTAADTPSQDARGDLVCGVSAWAASSLSHLGDEEGQAASFAAVARAVDDTVMSLVEAEPRVPTPDATANATVVVQIPDVRGVLSRRRADVAFANDVYLAYTVLMAGCHVLCLALVFAQATCYDKGKPVCVHWGCLVPNADGSGGDGDDDAAASPGGDGCDGASGSRADDDGGIHSSARSGTPSGDHDAGGERGGTHDLNGASGGTVSPLAHLAAI